VVRVVRAVTGTAGGEENAGSREGSETGTTARRASRVRFTRAMRPPAIIT
jgi:hypothetical protein